MTNETGDAFFEEFNAKYLDPEQVAAGYIYSEHFAELSGPYHAVLVGPRGSGKTTLLKMLQPAALEAWKGAKADSYREKIKYSGVFIASDISWSRQLASLGYGKLSPDNHRILVLACFTTHVLHAVLETMILRAEPCASSSYRAVTLSPENEGVLAKQLMSVLKVGAPLATLLSVKQTLRSRLSEIRQLGNRGSLLGHEEFQKILASTDYLHLDFLDISSNITALFNDLVKERGAHWALLFDELETAPDWIVGQLFSAFRVSDPKIFLKLAISPVSDIAFKALTSNDGPANGQDHRQIPLWYTDKVNAKGFCEAVWKSLTSKARISTTAREALGASAFEPADASETRHRNPYAPGEYWAELFKTLKRKDKSFAAFLRARNIDVDQLSEASQYTKDSILRKAAPVAAVRDFYLHEDRHGAVTAKNRKTSSLYAGAESIFAISEGNPRWLIGLLSPMIAYMITHNVKKVPKSVQADQIDSAAERLLALLRTIPVPAAVERSEVLGLNGIVQKIGIRLHGNLTIKNFTIDPRLSFTVDIQTPPSIVALLSVGLNRGAVMLVEGTPARSVVGNMNGTVLRLSYLLAAKYGLPLRKGKTTNLSPLLVSQKGENRESEPQLNLTGFKNAN